MTPRGACLTLALPTALTFLLLKQLHIHILFITKEDGWLGDVALAVVSEPLHLTTPTNIVSSKPSFNYSAYWERAWGAAVASTSTKVPGAELPCPKVYVYDLPAHLGDSDIQLRGHTNSSVVDKVFGHKADLKKDEKFLKGFLRHTNQYAFPTILEYRLRSSVSCHTDDPETADLFYAPIFTKPKSYTKEWTHVCRNISGENVAESLKYLNANNSHRHFFAIGKGHYVARKCRGWWAEPVKRLQSVRRLAYSHFDFVSNPDSQDMFHVQKPYNDTRLIYPNLFSVPYPSSVHFNANDSFSELISSTRRSLLMIFLGKDTHGDVLVRKEIRRQCERYNQTDPNICFFEDWRCATIAAKAKATFCLEPEGDSPWRKSLSDSIAFGCIPVLFSELTDAVAPWFWGDWKARGRVIVPRQAFLEGAIDLQKLLESIPPQLLEIMQETLRTKSRKFQYSIDEDMDSVRLILDSLHKEALTVEKSQGFQGTLR